jgi:hypothetical protein
MPCMQCRLLRKRRSVCMVAHSSRPRHSSVATLLSRWSTSCTRDSAQWLVTTTSSRETSPAVARRGCPRTTSGSSAKVAATSAVATARDPKDVPPARLDKVAGSLVAGSCAGEEAMAPTTTPVSSSASGITSGARDLSPVATSRAGDLPLAAALGTAELSAAGASDLPEAEDLSKDGALHMKEFQSKMKSDCLCEVKGVNCRGFNEPGLPYAPVGMLGRTSGAARCWHPLGTRSRGGRSTGGR